MICEARRQHPSWGPREAPGLARPAPSGTRFAGRQHGGRSPGAQGLVKKRRRRRRYQHPGVVPIDDRPAERSLDRGLQGPLSHPRWRLLLPADRGRPAHALPARVSRPALDQGHSACARSSTGCSASTACRTRFAPTMASRSRRRGFTACRSSMSGGCGSAFSISASDPRRPQENGAHERMHKTLKAEAIRPPRATLAPRSSARSTASAREYNDERPHQFLKGATPASLYRPSPRVYTGDAAADRVSRTLHREAHHERRDVPVQEEAALHRQLAEAAHHRPRGGRRRHLVDSFLPGPAGTARRTGLHHSRLTTRSVTHVPGLRCYLSSRLLTPFTGLSLNSNFETSCPFAERKHRWRTLGMGFGMVPSAWGCQAGRPRR